MEFEFELPENNPFPNEGHLTTKNEPFNEDFIKKELTEEKKEEEEEECFVILGLVEHLNVDEVPVKEKVCENREMKNYSSSKVSIFLMPPSRVVF